MRVAVDIAAERVTRDSWRFLGARSQAEARGYFMSSMRRAWGVAFVREMARRTHQKVTTTVHTVSRGGSAWAMAGAAGT